MATIVRTSIVKFGNSQGIRIPKILLEQAKFDQEVELEVQEGWIIISSARTVREGWEESFKKMAAAGDDALLDVERPTQWDETEWEW
jgi:antitoxin MazE